MDPQETIEEQERRILRDKEEGDRHFTEAGMVAENTIDLVRQARAKMAENKVDGTEDSCVSEMIKQLSQEKIYEITRCFQKRFMEKSTRSQDASKSALWSWMKPLVLEGLCS